MCMLLSDLIWFKTEIKSHIIERFLKRKVENHLLKLPNLFCLSFHCMLLYNDTKLIKQPLKSF